MDTLRDIADEHVELARKLEGSGVKYAVGAWIDVLGRAKSKTVPIDHLPNLLAGSERYTPRGMGGIGHMDPVEPEGIAAPDPSSLQVLPWDPRIAWMVADMRVDAETTFALCPRSILKRQLEEAETLGYHCMLGVEPEFYAFEPESLAPRAPALVPMARSGALAPSPAYDVEATLDSMPFLDKVVGYMEKLNFGLFSFDAEGGQGQYEFDFAHAPALASADRMTLFRLLVKQAAKECGLVVTFMPKPFTESWGSGAHFNMSLETAEGGSVFQPEGGTRGWSKEAMQFVAGILRHAPALAALANPTTNSYRRLVDRLADGQVSWAPTRISYGFNNRSCMLRLPGNRPAVENRSVDMAANTYLVASYMLAAGIEGIRDSLDPGEAADDLTYASARPRLPRTLIEAVEAFEADPLTQQVFEPAFIRDYVEMKVGEWERERRSVTVGERDAYLLNL